MGKKHRKKKEEKSIRSFTRKTALCEDCGRYFNRELSWLKFNERILDEARSTQNPLLERVAFLGIAAGNLDEFFMVRVPAYQRGATRQSDEYEEVIGSRTQLEMIYERTIFMMRNASWIWEKELKPALEKEGILFQKYAACSESEKRLARKELSAILAAAPANIIRGSRFQDIGQDDYPKGMGLLVKLDRGFAIVSMQDILDKHGRFMTVGKREPSYLFREDAFRNNCDLFFPDESVRAVALIRLTRDSDLNLKGDDADDLISAIRGAPETLAKKLPSRLETEQWMPFGYTAHLADTLSLLPELVYDVPSPLGLADLKKFPALRPELQFPAYDPSLPADLSDTKKIFSRLANRDIMLFTPYDSFDGLVNFLHAAANDPTVQKIQMTLYRLGAESPVVGALIAAAKNGKDVTAAIELKASFDEEANFHWAATLAENGVTVIHGVPGLKVHAKCCLVTRLEEGKNVRYATISTGNYNAKTAKIYSDISLFTADQGICLDLSTLFSNLTGDEKKPEYRQLLVSPDFMEDQLISLIKREINHHTSHGHGHIILKTNSLTHRPLINALYEASGAGVKIDLIVRGICMLRPGVLNLSENIRVISIVGRFLEHSRIFYFRNDGDEQVFIGSPDLMSRNLKRRVEIICPIHDRKIKNAIINKILPAFIHDAAQGYVLEQNGVYQPPRDLASKGSQQQFIEMRKIWW